MSVLNLCTNALGQISDGPYYAVVVAPAPASPTDPMFVVIPEIDDSTSWEFDEWPLSHADGLPQEDAVCLIAFDNRRNLRLLWWDGQPAGSYAILGGDGKVGSSGGSTLSSSAVDAIGDPRWAKTAQTGPFTVDWGSAVVTVAASAATGTASVTFHTPFAAAPTVRCSLETNSLLGARVQFGSITTTGFTAVAFWYDGATTHSSNTPTFHWEAIG